MDRYLRRLSPIDISDIRSPMLPTNRSRCLWTGLLLAGCVVLGPAAHGEDGPPAWAFPLKAAGYKAPPDDGRLRHVPGSTMSYTTAQTRDRFLAPDWHPGDHPPMPDVVAHGRKPDVLACGFCHRADGPGGPENASLAGLPAAYIVQQMADFKSGERRSSVPEFPPPQLMSSVAKAANEAEIEAAAAYFAALKPRASIKVVETDTVPRTYVAGVFLADAGTGEKEPIGPRIIEVPENLEQFESRDTRSRFVAYVPVDSIEKGKKIARGADAAAACVTCHGPELKGAAAIPGLAGRSPSYIVRQLYDFQHGKRAGPGSTPMMPVVEKLTIDDMIAVAAYLASLRP
jgi:cytochrome c553